jgi:isoleucyl-tRNA synthetase
MQELLGSEAAEYRKLSDTLDVWFDSGSTHFAVLKQRPELAWPADCTWKVATSIAAGSSPPC